jgi:acetoin utilization deacetylase AcuC-like enzyme
MRVYYSREMVAENADSFSPSASKPAKVIADWRAKGFSLDVKKPLPVSGKTMAQAHDPSYIQGLLSCTLPNGFGNKDEGVARSLPFTVGAMVSATKYALKTGQPAAALCSGFHHAGYGGGSGFCSVNGLIVAAIEAKKAGAKSVGILDLDQHYGNGTDNIIRKLKLKWIEHYTAGQFRLEAEKFLADLPRLLRKTFYKCDVMIVQLGADPFIDDPLGGWMTMEQMERRDRIVFETFKQMGIGVAWNLAGGYSKDENGEITPVLQIHANSAKACIETHKRERKAS